MTFKQWLAATVETGPASTQLEGDHLDTVVGVLLFGGWKLADDDRQPNFRSHSGLRGVKLTNGEGLFAEISTGSFLGTFTEISIQSY